MAHNEVGYPHIYTSSIDTYRQWYGYVFQHFQGWWKRDRIICVCVLVAFALILLPGPRLWRQYIRPRREPELAKKAREYLLRLRVEKTVTWGTNLQSPAVRGASLNLNRGGSASYTPWTLPELVSHTRHFMEEISAELKSSSHAAIIGIDEIDRIGSLEHAERFVGEIKSIFGVERCFFLVAVAEDVGSIFAQRATAGRSILENAFDDIVVVEPLNFEETRDLLIKRVPGFTDSFVYLVHALSGGLPRELIRVTRRLVEVNQELRKNINRYPRLEDLSLRLVSEEVVEAIRATRSQMSRLTLHTNWAIFFEELRVASVRLRGISLLDAQEMYGVIEKLSDVDVPDFPGRDTIMADITAEDEGKARRIARNFSAFAYFGMTVIDAFSDGFFDLQVVRQRTAKGFEGSYEELAAARTELAISPASSQAMLRRFRESLDTHGAE